MIVDRGKRAYPAGHALELSVPPRGGHLDDELMFAGVGALTLPNQ
jgi:hypothetical protein